MSDWKRYINIRNIVLAVPWVYAAVYLYVLYGMSVLYNDVMSGKAVVDPIYDNMELTMMMSYWITAGFIVLGYVLIRYTCRSVAGMTASARLSSLEKRVRELEDKGQ